MEHILNSRTEGIDFDRYSGYVESIKHQLSPHVYAFASDPGHFNLTSPTSLHDAWLESFTVREVAEGERQEIRRMAIELCFLGPFHDRRIYIHYAGVMGYSCSAPTCDEADQTAHGDLFTHEIRLAHNGILVHELVFERGSKFFIECEDIRHSEKLLS